MSCNESMDQMSDQTVIIAVNLDDCLTIDVDCGSNESMVWPQIEVVIETTGDDNIDGQPLDPQMVYESSDDQEMSKVQVKCSQSGCHHMISTLQEATSHWIECHGIVNVSDTTTTSTGHESVAAIVSALETNGNDYSNQVVTDGGVSTDLASMDTNTGPNGSKSARKSAKMAKSLKEAKRIKCLVTDCDYECMARSMSDLFEHLMSGHQIETIYQCNYRLCNEMFVTMAHINGHIQDKHYAYQPFGGRLVAKHSISELIRGYSGHHTSRRSLKTFSCRIAGCDHVFNSLTHYKKHRLNAHSV